MSEQRWVKVARDGKVIYSKPLPDYAERRLAAETPGKMRSMFPTNQEQERLALLQIQQNFAIVPPLPPDKRSEAEKKAWLESLPVIDE